MYWYACIVFWLWQRTTFCGTLTSHHYRFIAGEQFVSSWLSISGFFFYFKCMYPSRVCYVFQLQCTLWIYFLIYFIFIRSGDDLGAFIIRYNLSSCGDYTSVFPRVFFGAIWGQSTQADKQKKMKECWNLWRIDWLIVPLDASNSNAQSYEIYHSLPKEKSRENEWRFKVKQLRAAF